MTDFRTEEWPPSHDSAERLSAISERRLDLYRNLEFQAGASLFKQLLWYATSAFIFETKFVPLSSWKRSILRWFGARVGRGVVIKPNVRIKFPWRLSIGDHSWIGESVWIDNLADVQIGPDVCLSQDVYLCTGSHDSSKETFDLITLPIAVGRGVWIAARATVLPGVTIGDHSVIYAGAVVTKTIGSGQTVAGVPARPVGVCAALQANPD